MNKKMKCPVCQFEQWNPIAQLDVGTLSLYDDARFPGRCILSLTEHYEYIEDMPEDLLSEFLQDSTRAIRSIRDATGANRVNLAILGNTVPHVHAHLIPRYPESEVYPTRSPWNDPRPHAPLERKTKSLIIERIRAMIQV